MNFMRSLAIAAAIGSLSIVGGCSALSTIVGEQTATSIEKNALKGAKLALTVWVDVVQPGIKLFGKRPTCGEGVTLICKDQKAWDRVKEIEAQTQAQIDRAEPLIAAGTNDVKLLTAVAAAVFDAQRSTASAMAGIKGTVQ